MDEDDFFQTLVAELDNDDIVGIIVGGSYARGEATPYSDVDIACFVPDSSKVQLKRFFYRHGRLISIASKSIEGIRRDLARPELAILFTAGRRRILLDKDGSVSRLMQEIDDFRWETLQTSADQHASFQMMAWAEGAHKILSALLNDDELALAYVTEKLLLELTRIVAVQRGVLVKSDSTYYRQLYESVGPDTVWTYYHRIAAGIDMPGVDHSSVKERGKACLCLYQETAKLLEPVLRPEHHEVVEGVVEVITRGLRHY